MINLKHTIGMLRFMHDKLSIEVFELWIVLEVSSYVPRKKIRNLIFSEKKVDCKNRRGDEKISSWRVDDEINQS